MAQLKFVLAYREVTEACGASAALVYGYLILRDGRWVPHRDLTANTGLSGPTIDRALYRLKGADPPFIQIERRAGKPSIFHDLRQLGLHHNDVGGVVSARCDPPQSDVPPTSERCDDPPQSDVPPTSERGGGRIKMMPPKEESHGESINTNGAPSPTGASHILDVYPGRYAPIAALREISSAIGRIAGGTDPGNDLPPDVRGNEAAASRWLWGRTKQYADTRAGKPSVWTPYPAGWYADGCYLQLPQQSPADQERRASAQREIDRYKESISHLEGLVRERAVAGRPTEGIKKMIAQERSVLATWQKVP